jgi:hypothetical protein
MAAAWKIARASVSMCVVDQCLAASGFNVAAQFRGRINSALLSHEAGGAVAVHDDAAQLRHSRLQADFHRRLSERNLFHSHHDILIKVNPAEPRLHTPR